MADQSMNECDEVGVGGGGFQPQACEGGGDPCAGAGDGEGLAVGSCGHLARVRCLDQVKACGFTFAKGKVVAGVPLAHAEFLVERGKAEILEVF